MSSRLRLERHDRPRRMGSLASRAAHVHLMDAIFRLEATLNARVYALFDLTPAAIEVIEETTQSL